jgi:hypothetical protein
LKNVRDRFHAGGGPPSYLMLLDPSREAHRIEVLEETLRLQAEAAELRIELQHRRAQMQHAVAMLHR